MRRSEKPLAALVLAALQALVPACLCAQDEPKVSMMIDVVAWGDPIPGIMLGPEKKGKSITAESFTYSEPVRYSGPKLLAVHQTAGGDKRPALPGTAEDKEHEAIPLPVEEVKVADTAGETPLAKELAKELARRREEDPTLVALVPLPDNSRRVTLLLAPAGRTTFQGYVIDDDPTKLPLGAVRVHNLSPVQIQMHFGSGRTRMMKPRQAVVVQPENGRVAYQLSYLMDDEWRIQENNMIPVFPNEQTQFIVLKSTNRFFLSTDGAAGGFLQAVKLRRRIEDAVP